MLTQIILIYSRPIFFSDQQNFSYMDTDHTDHTDTDQHYTDKHHTDQHFSYMDQQKFFFFSDPQP